MTSWREIACTTVLFGVLTFLGINWHSHSPKFTYHSEIWADRAGYHSYLPAFLDYRADPALFPKGIDDLTGNGFELDSIPHRMVTKYPVGVAMLSAPFYLLGKVLRTKQDAAMAGFSPIDHIMVDVAAAFYCSVGCLFLFLLLRRNHSALTAIGTVLALLTGTNLLFYTIGDPGMSHVYAFFLLSCFVLAHAHILDFGPSRRRLLLLGFIGGLVVVTRPTDILLLPFLLLITAATKKEARDRFIAMVNVKAIAPFLFGFLLACLPQLIYWQFTFGNFIHWSYTGEGFTHWKDPAIVPFWLSPYNGLFTYSPLVLLTLMLSWIGMKPLGIQYLTIWSSFLVFSYICASWWAWTFGCGFGSRNFVEYGPILTVPIAYMISRSHRYTHLISLLIILCCFYTVKLTFSYDQCWFGGIWDWEMFSNTLLGPFK